MSDLTSVSALTLVLVGTDVINGHLSKWRQISPIQLRRARFLRQRCSRKADYVERATIGFLNHRSAIIWFRVPPMAFDASPNSSIK